MTLFENTPYRSDKDLIQAYNSFMELLPKNSWALFRDADTLFLDSFYGQHIIDAIEQNPNTGCFTCLTNRIGQPAQLHNEYKGDDITIHRQISHKLKQLNGLSYKTFVGTKYNLMSGMVMVIKKETWENIGGFKEWSLGHSKILGVDNKLHLDLEKHNYDVKVLTGLYVYHWYRGGDMYDTKHLR